jgi:hypothetical protein
VTAPPPPNPYGVTTEAVHALVPYRRLDTPTSAAPPGTATVADEDVQRWVSDLSQSLTSRLMVMAGGADSILIVADDGTVTVNPGVPGADERFAILSGIARDAITNGAASYWDAAMNPERQGVNNTTYAGVLWQRYLDGIAAAITLVGQWLSQGSAGGGGTDDGGFYYDGFGWVSSLFPPPAFADTIRW